MQKPHFTLIYEYFTWVEAWPGNGMHLFFLWSELLLFYNLYRTFLSNISYFFFFWIYLHIFSRKITTIIIIYLIMFFSFFDPNAIINHGL